MFSRGGSLSRICRGTGAGRPDHKTVILPYDKKNKKNKENTKIFTTPKRRGKFRP